MRLRTEMKLISLKVIIAVVFSLFFIRCSAEKIEQPNEIRDECDTTGKKIEWIGKTYEEAVSILGNPITEESFNLSDTFLTEFRLGLEKIKSDSDRNENEIREATWSEGECRLTLWFKRKGMETISIDTLYWNEKMEF